MTRVDDAGDGQSVFNFVVCNRVPPDNDDARFNSLVRTATWERLEDMRQVRRTQFARSPRRPTDLRRLNSIPVFLKDSSRSLLVAQLKTSLRLCASRREERVSKSQSKSLWNFRRYNEVITKMTHALCPQDGCEHANVSGRTTCAALSRD